ncbi:MAG: hypothetical protein ACLR23_18100 [Clostridia bacterium]
MTPEDGTDDIFIPAEGVGRRCTEIRCSVRSYSAQRGIGKRPVRSCRSQNMARTS